MKKITKKQLLLFTIIAAAVLWLIASILISIFELGSVSNTVYTFWKGFLIMVGFDIAAVAVYELAKIADALNAGNKETGAGSQDGEDKE